jgi:SAM-dependent methyltransferase
MICRLCGKNNLRLYYTQGNRNEYKFYKCAVCGLVNYDLSAGLDQSKYSPEKFISPDDNTRKQNTDQINSYRFFRKYIKNTDRLFDIGCGNGKFLLEARKDGWLVIGLELSEFLAAEIKKRYGIEIIVSDFLNYQNDNEKYNAVIIRHVLEHLPDPLQAMNKINSMLKPGGYSLIEVPDIDSYELKIKRFIIKTGIYKKKYKESYKPGHCNEFNREAFEFLLKKTGFKLIMMQNYSSKTIFNYIYKYIHFGTKARVLIQKEF